MPFQLGISRIGEAALMLHSADLCTINKLYSQLSEKARRFAYFTDVEEKLRLPWLGLVTVRDEKVLVALATFSDTSTLLRHCITIDDVIVDETYRGQKLGRMMMEAIEAYARQHRYGMLELTSQPRRLEANGLYQSLGFELRETNPYRKKLD
jgi:GNAT superfamily N-acetyltransferase